MVKKGIQHFILTRFMKKHEKSLCWNKKSSREQLGALWKCLPIIYNINVQNQNDGRRKYSEHFTNIAKSFPLFIILYTWAEWASLGPDSTVGDWSFSFELLNANFTLHLSEVLKCKQLKSAEKRSSNIIPFIDPQLIQNLQIPACYRWVTDPEI